MITVVTDMTMCGMAFGGSWVCIYEDRVHRRRVIVADEIEYDL